MGRKQKSCVYKLFSYHAHGYPPQLSLYGPRPWLSATVITLRAMPMVIRHNYNFIRHNYYSTGHAHGYPPQLYHHANGQTSNTPWATHRSVSSLSFYGFAFMFTQHPSYICSYWWGGFSSCRFWGSPAALGVQAYSQFSACDCVSVIFQSWPSNRFWLQLTTGI